MQQIDWKQKFAQIEGYRRKLRAQPAGHNFLIDYTHISHIAREQYKLSLIEYVAYDTINACESGIHSREMGGWVYATKDQIAESLGVSRRTIERAIRKGLDDKLLEKQEEYKLLRTTAAWKNAVLYWKKNNSAQAMETSSLVRHSHIYHQVRKYFELSLEQYTIIALIQSYESGSQSQAMGGWVFSKKETLAKSLGLNRTTIHSYISVGLEKKLLEQHKNHRALLRTSLTWKNEVIFCEDKIKNKKNT